MLLTFEGRDYELRPGESVLEGMARHGVGIPSACRAGSCQACVVRSVAGDPGPEARQGLKPTWLASGYFLACMARPSGDLGSGVLRVRVRPDRPVEFRPGQHVALTRAGGVTRIYSLANLPAEAADEGLEFHVRAYRGGAMSGWLAGASAGARLAVGSPAGECFYAPSGLGGPMLLAGTGTGIAPLLAIARHALALGHEGPLALVHGAAGPGGFYLGTGAPGTLAAAVAGRARLPGSPACGSPGPVTWRTCCLSRGEDITAVVLDELARLTAQPGTVTAYLCGGSGSVARMRRALFLAGMSLSDILADQFSPAAS